MILRNTAFLLGLGLLTLTGCSSKSSCGTPYCPAVADGCWYEPVDECSCGPVVCSDAGSAVDAATDASMGDGAMSDADMSDGSAGDSGVVDSGVVDSGVVDSGVVDSGATSDSGVVDSGAVDSGVADSGAVDSGVADSGAVDSGCLLPPCAAPPPGCRYVGGGACSCGTLVCRDAGGPSLTCTSNADCSLSQYCALPSGCSGTGSCQPRPTMCIDVYAPVCGCNGTTYGNTCDAAGAGVNVSATGECADCRTTGCRGTATCQLCRGAGGGVYVCLPSGTAC